MRSCVRVSVTGYLLRVCMIVRSLFQLRCRARVPDAPSAQPTSLAPDVENKPWSHFRRVYKFQVEMATLFFQCRIVDMLVRVVEVKISRFFCPRAKCTLPVGIKVNRTVSKTG